ncbi:hypothetical protein JIG36_28750 [Actinoplanes sp. LDG1-06]|uniref:Carrier domain-containing protein n=2 Tax=Paractinoplanes ovalisporus TaxID=2810368 RepID=A0ABS2AI69_9ACTN|nr:hypothetical protein [Actinoplanes ovalisporus]
MPARLDREAWRARGDSLPAVLRGLVRPVRPAAADGARPGDRLRRRLGELSGPARLGALLDLVRGSAAAVLGHADPARIDLDRGFLDAGFDSLTALELRNQLIQETGLGLPPTLLFDHPDPGRLARHLLAELDGGDHSGILAELDRLAVTLDTADGDADTRRRVTARLETLLSKWRDRPEPGRPNAEPAEPADDDELFALIDHELGLS